MSIATPPITNFTAGELSPRLEGRIDISKYYNGCRQLYNMYVHPHGGATRRSGFRFIQEVHDSTSKSRLIRFAFSPEQTYMIELSEKKARFFMNRSLILKESVPYVIDTPYTAEQLCQVKFYQSADIMILVHPDVAPHKLTRLAHDNWTLAPYSLSSPPNFGSGQPSVVTVFDERLCLCGSAGKPDTIFLSRTNDWPNFAMNTNTEPGGDPLADDAIEFTLTGDEVCGIKDAVPRKDLWLIASGGEWVAGSSTSGDAITPENRKATNESPYGSSGVGAVVCGGGVLYVDQSRRKIRVMNYQFADDSFSSSDTTILSEHITKPGICAISYAQHPDSVLWCLRDDGVLVGLTYEPRQEVVAWHRHETDGKIESIACMFNSDTSESELWCVIKRTLGDGTEKRYIEVMEAQFDGDEAKEAFFVDSGISYEGAAKTEFSGLDHLEGLEVQILADGGVKKNQTVTSGSIVLDQPASVVHVGLPFKSVLQPPRIEAGSQRGTAQGKRKRVLECSVRFYKTIGAKVGPSPDKLKSVKFDDGQLNTAAPLYSGDHRIPFPKGWDRDGLVTVVQDLPLPMSILMIIPKVVVHE